MSLLVPDRICQNMTYPRNQVARGLWSCVEEDMVVLMLGPVCLPPHHPQHQQQPNAKQCCSPLKIQVSRTPLLYVFCCTDDSQPNYVRVVGGYTGHAPALRHGEVDGLSCSARSWGAGNKCNWVQSFTQSAKARLLIHQSAVPTVCPILSASESAASDLRPFDSHSSSFLFFISLFS